MFTVAKLFASTNVLHMPLGILRIIVWVQELRWVRRSQWFAFKTGKCLLRKYFFVRTKHLNLFALITATYHFAFFVDLKTCASKGNASAKQVAFRSLGPVRANGNTICIELS